MTVPDYIVEVAFGHKPRQDPIAPFVYTDITSSVRRWHLDRATKRAGTATVLLDGRDGAFRSDNTSGPYHPDIMPMVPARIIATWDSGIETFAMRTSGLRGGHGLRAGLHWDPQITGYAESWVESYQDPDVTVTMTIVDGFRPWTLEPFAASPATEMTGQRINAIIDYYAFLMPSERRLDAGTRTVQAKTYTGSLLDAFFETMESEGGIFFMGRDGAFVFYDADHPSLPVEDGMVWGDDPGELRYRYGSFQRITDEQTIYNSVEVTAPALTTQTASDIDPSRFAYFLRDLSVSTILAFETDMLTLANELLARYSQPHPLVPRIDLGVSDADWPRLLGRDLWDKILVRRRPPGNDLGFEQESLIEGISIDVPNSSEWHITWMLSAVQTNDLAIPPGAGDDLWWLLF